MTDLFIVGRYIDHIESGGVWDFVGVFDSEQKANDACLDLSYFIGPAKLNISTPREKHEWVGAYYPKQ